MNGPVPPIDAPAGGRRPERDGRPGERHPIPPRSGMGASGEPVWYVREPDRGRRLAARLRGARPLFVVTAAHTDTSAVPGISAAGAAYELIPYTPAADLEALLHGAPRCLPSVPSNPLGAPGPVLLARAAVRLADLPVRAVEAGLRVRPDAPTLCLPCAPGRSVESGDAVPEAADLFELGLDLGRRWSREAPYLLLGETVPGGTTTALTLLLGLGYDATGRTSSSLPGNAHALKQAVARRALAAARLPDCGERSALVVARALGDPMQPVVAGLLLGALPRAPVVLAGGTQMAAVLALAAALARERGLPLDAERVAIATTRWVAADPTADLAGLVAQVGPYPVLAADLDFSRSRIPGLRRYEAGLVKEGVGAGGAAVAAALAVGARADDLLRATERAHDETLARRADASLS